MRIEDVANFSAYRAAAAHHARCRNTPCDHTKHAAPIEFSRYLQRQNEEAARNPPPAPTDAPRPIAPTQTTETPQPTRYAPTSPVTDARGGYFLPTLGQIPTASAPAVPPAPHAPQAPNVQHIVDHYHPIGTRIDVVV